jgi:putative endopeptidase
MNPSDSNATRHGFTRDHAVTKLSSIALVAVGLCMSTQIAHAQTTADAASPARVAGVDSRIKPGDDFNAYANGAWLQATELPANKGRWGGRDEIEATTKKQITDAMDEAAARPAGSYARKAADFRAAYVDEAAIESKGLAPLKPAFDRIAKVHDKTALTRLLGSDLRADVDPLNWGIYDSPNLFGLAVQLGIHGEKNNFVYLAQGGLGLSDRDAYLSDVPAMQALRTRYRDYIEHVLQAAGFENAKQRANAVMALEIAIAHTHATDAESGNEHNADVHWTRANFPSKAPGVDWSTFFAAAGLSKQNEFAIWQPGAITGEAALVASQPIETWKDYLRFHVVDQHADVLPRTFSEAAITLHAAELSTAAKPRDQRAMDAATKAMPEAVGRLYVEKYFPAQTKAKVQSIVANVMEAFGKRIEAVSWMSPSSKTLALVKLKKIYVGVGYPEKWTDYADLVIEPHDAYGNQDRVSEWNRRQALARIDRPVDPTEWLIAASAVAAVYLPLQNGYNFSAAFLQSPKFDPNASDATNYGAFGATIGHEISHFFDTLGADYDASGAMHHWWLPDDEARYKTLSDALVAQYSAYHPLPGLSIDGKLALSENIADLGGLNAAFDAYRSTLGSRVNDRDYVRQQDQQFFIGFARGWRVKMNEVAFRAKAATDHAPEGLRIATVRNMSAWYDAFDVQPGQGLYLDPKARVGVW